MGRASSTNQVCRRLQRRAAEIKAIGAQRCIVCFETVHLGERKTKRYCSDACRQTAHRLRRAGKWAKHEQLRALRERCERRLALARSFEALKAQFNTVCYLNKLGVTTESAQPVMERMVAAQHEQKREAATVETLVSAKFAARRLRRLRRTGATLR